MIHAVIYQEKPAQHTPPKRTKPLNVRLTDRDREIIKAVYLYRVLETPQLQALFFNGNPDNQYSGLKGCQQRLKALERAGYVHQGEQASKLLTEGRKPFIYQVGRRGAELLPEILGIPAEMVEYKPARSDITDQFLNHLLRTNDIRISITLAAEKIGWTIDTWIDDKTLKSTQQKDCVALIDARGKRRDVAVVPDGYFTLSHLAGRTYHHFIEADLGTVTVVSKDWKARSWARKVRAYTAYFKSGLFKKRHNGAKQLKILTVTKSRERMSYLKEITEKTDGHHRFWFTTFDQITPQSVLTQPIWSVATKEATEVLIKQ